VEDDKGIVVDMAVDQLMMPAIRSGMPFQFSLYAFPDVLFTGVLSDVDTTPRDGGWWGMDQGMGGWMVSYRILGSLTPPDEHFRILGGMNGMVTLIKAERRGVLVVPVMAVGYDEQGGYVYRQQWDTFEKVPVTIWVQTPELVEIVEGLRLGDVIKGSAFDDQTIQTMGIDQSSVTVDQPQY